MKKKIAKKVPARKPRRSSKTRTASYLKGRHTLRADDIHYAKIVNLPTHGAYEFDRLGTAKQHDVYWSNLKGCIRIAGCDFAGEQAIFKPIREVKAPKKARK